MRSCWWCTALCDSVVIFDLMDYRSFSKFSALDRSSKGAEDILKHFPFRPAATQARAQTSKQPRLGLAERHAPSATWHRLPLPPRKLCLLRLPQASQTPQHIPN
jgi:hypothetical protein